ncbi:MAG: cache domain-containing protein, partial [Roseibium sp.]
MSFSRWPLFWKISLPVIIVLAFTAALSAISLSSLHTAMLGERIKQIQSLSDSAKAIAAAFHEKEAAGEMSREEAQAAAAQSIAAMRFDGGNYIFVYDNDGINIVHPKASLNGTSMIDFKDKTGVRIVAELIDLAKAGGGSLLYYWPRANSDVAIEKYGWGVGFQPWSWMIGTG